VLNQYEQQVKGFRRKRDGFMVAEKRALTRVDAKRPKLQQVAG
jgi:hypothetical protein